MSTRNAVPKISLPLAILVVWTASAVANGPKAVPNSTPAFKGAAKVTSPARGFAAFFGSPLKGVDVKLGKNPGGNVIAQRITDGSGKFDFGVVDQGSYFIVLSLPQQKVSKQQESSTGRTDVKTCFITITGVAGTGQITSGWDFEVQRAFDPNDQNTAKATSPNEINFNADGSSPVEGAVVKSKSNTTNN